MDNINHEQNTGVFGLDTKTVKLCESIFDLAFTAGYMNGKGELPEAEDSREVFAAILDLAYLFEQDLKEEEYMDAIAAYAEENLGPTFAKLTSAKAAH